MTLRIEVGPLPGGHDPLGRKTLASVSADFPGLFTDIRTVRVYTVADDIPADVLDAWARHALSDPVTERYSLEGLPNDADWTVEVDFKPGVTDNEGRTAHEALCLLMPDAPPVFSGMQYRICGSAGREEIFRLAENFLANTLIQRIRIASRAEAAAGRLKANPPLVRLAHEPVVRTVSLEGGDEHLAALSRQNVWALTPAEIRVIRDWFARPRVREERRACGLPEDPTDVEMECLAQSWSEHCKHKIFSADIEYTDEHGRTERIRGLFSTYIRETTRRIRELDGAADRCLSVFSDNAGVVRFDDEYGLVFKVETHNSPSALDPYGGALTGIVGVNRDPFGTGLGAELLFNTDVFCLADPRMKDVPPGLLHPMRILEGVRTGVEHGGNQSGIPTVNGSVVFDDRYVGKPLVYCGTGGLLPLRVAGREGFRKYVKPGDLVVMVGGRIGKDGIHGATFSSVELSEESPSSAVQIGDPITQKRMFDFLLRARDAGLYSGITDNGAGGLSSSVGEMATLSGGAEIDLARAPLKYAGLDPWEILVSESQERMTVAVPPESIDAFLELSRLMNVESTVLGKFTDSGVFSVHYGEKPVARLDLGFLHDGLPRMQLRCAWEPPAPVRAVPEKVPALRESLLALLARPNIASKEYWVRQYDHEVKGRTVVKPLTGFRHDGPSDAAVMRPRFESLRGIAVSHGLCPRYSDIDAGAMAAAAVDEAVRNAVAVGADPETLSALDNFCWPDPIEPAPDAQRKLAALVRANQELARVCLAYRLPLISGKDSMKNDARVGNTWISVPPTLLVSVLGILPDVRRAQTMDFKRPGHLVYVLGTTRRELGGSEYFAELKVKNNTVPQVHAEENLLLYKKLHKAISAGLVASCHDASDGGLGVALAESAFSGRLGCEVEIGAIPVAEHGMRDDEILFSESTGRFVASVDPKHAGEFEAMLEGCTFARVGRVTDEPVVRMRTCSGAAVEWSVDECFRAWHEPLDFSHKE